MKAENVAIRYITGDFKDIGIKEYMVRNLTGNYHVKEFMAVDGVSFELHEGELLGIIGSNGAGKSTLLKAVAGIMEPTRGSITANGEVAALLELGSGFDGDLTVRENAYLRGAMLGYTKEFMDSTYDQIIDFAELREFEDQPFKQLSSGMKSRLAFSIASLVKPDILILDEVLSVGDGAFQEKSAKKMREIIAQGATTILVSHSLAQIRELCTKVLWLDHGHQVAFGETQAICDRYEKFLRGEFSARMEDETPAAAESVEMPASLTQKPRRKWLTAAACALVLGLFAMFIAFTAVNQRTAQQSAYEEIQIRASTLAGGVIYRGAAIGEIWYSPSDTVVSSDGWDFDMGENTYSATDERSVLTVKLPAATGRTMTFAVGPEQGVAEISLNGATERYTLYSAEDVSLGWSYAVPDPAESENGAWQAALVAGAVGVIVALAVLLLYMLKKETTPKRAAPREI